MAGSLFVGICGYLWVFVDWALGRMVAHAQVGRCFEMFWAFDQGGWAMF